MHYKEFQSTFVHISVLDFANKSELIYGTLTPPCGHEQRLTSHFTDKYYWGNFVLFTVHEWKDNIPLMM